MGFVDEDILSEPDLTEPDLQDVNVPTAYKGAITRQRARILQHKFNHSIRQATLKAEQEKAKEKAIMIEIQDQPVIEANQPVMEANQIQLWSDANEAGPSSWNQEEWPILSLKAQVQVFKIEWEETGA
ncbi:unnamed protein product [Microthlaspi erraticum]|uniref:Uncharacterized protein n=1 Tax=Microthlaspi erraticum TaxID=1685480 RepID=A0A6D2J3B4_9BRAS|nr:unnamed protein product [Microthlaspi erraticum]